MSIQISNVEDRAIAATMAMEKNANNNSTESSDKENVVENVVVVQSDTSPSNFVQLKRTAKSSSVDYASMRSHLQPAKSHNVEYGEGASPYTGQMRHLKEGFFEVTLYCDTTDQFFFNIDPSLVRGLQVDYTVDRSLTRDERCRSMLLTFNTDIHSPSEEYECRLFNRVQTSIGKNRVDEEVQKVRDYFLYLMNVENRDPDTAYYLCVLNWSCRIIAGESYRSLEDNEERAALPLESRSKNKLQPSDNDSDERRSEIRSIKAGTLKPPSLVRQTPIGSEKKEKSTTATFFLPPLFPLQPRQALKPRKMTPFGPTMPGVRWVHSKLLRHVAKQRRKHLDRMRLRRANLWVAHKVNRAIRLQKRKNVSPPISPAVEVEMVPPPECTGGTPTPASPPNIDGDNIPEVGETISVETISVETEPADVPALPPRSLPTVLKRRMIRGPTGVIYDISASGAMKRIGNVTIEAKPKHGDHIKHMTRRAHFQDRKKVSNYLDYGLVPRQSRKMQRHLYNADSIHSLSECGVQKLVYRARPSGPKPKRLSDLREAWEQSNIKRRRISFGDGGKHIKPLLKHGGKTKIKPILKLQECTTLAAGEETKGSGGKKKDEHGGHEKGQQEAKEKRRTRSQSGTVGASGGRRGGRGGSSTSGSSGSGSSSSGSGDDDSDEERRKKDKKRKKKKKQSKKDKKEKKRKEKERKKQAKEAEKARVAAEKAEKEARIEREAKRQEAAEKEEKEKEKRRVKAQRERQRRQRKREEAAAASKALEAVKTASKRPHEDSPTPGTSGTSGTAPQPVVIKFAAHHTVDDDSDSEEQRRATSKRFKELRNISHVDKHDKVVMDTVELFAKAIIKYINHNKSKDRSRLSALEEHVATVATQQAALMKAIKGGALNTKPAVTNGNLQGPMHMLPFKDREKMEKAMADPAVRSQLVTVILDRVPKRQNFYVCIVHLTLAPDLQGLLYLCMQKGESETVKKKGSRLGMVRWSTSINVRTFFQECIQEGQKLERFGRLNVFTGMEKVAREFSNLRHQRNVARMRQLLKRLDDGDENAKALLAKEDLAQWRADFGKHGKYNTSKYSWRLPDEPVLMVETSEMDVDEDVADDVPPEDDDEQAPTAHGSPATTEREEPPTPEVESRRRQASSGCSESSPSKRAKESASDLSHVNFEKSFALAKHQGQIVTESLNIAVIVEKMPTAEIHRQLDILKSVPEKEHMEPHEYECQSDDPRPMYFQDPHAKLPQWVKDLSQLKAENDNSYRATQLDDLESERDVLTNSSAPEYQIAEINGKIRQLSREPATVADDVRFEWRKFNGELHYGNFILDNGHAYYESLYDELKQAALKRPDLAEKSASPSKDTTNSIEVLKVLTKKGKKQGRESTTTATNLDNDSESSSSSNESSGSSSSGSSSSSDTD